MDYDLEIMQIQRDYPELTFKNKGYQYLSKEVRERNKEGIELVSNILKKTIIGFSRFDNFFPSKEDDGTYSVRVQYNYGATAERSNTHFIGVGYFPLDYFKNYGGQGENINTR